MPTAELALLPLTANARRTNPNANRSGAVSGSLISTTSPRIAAAERGSDFTNASTRWVISCSDSLPVRELASTTTCSQISACFGRALEGLFVGQAGGVFASPEVEKSRRQHNQFARDVTLLSGCSTLRQGFGLAESRSQPAAGQPAPLAAITKGLENNRIGARCTASTQRADLGIEWDRNQRCRAKRRFHQK